MNRRTFTAIMASTHSKFGLMTTRKTRVAIIVDKWLDKQAKLIQKMILDWEEVEAKKLELYNMLCEPQLYPQVLEIINTCITQISVASDQMLVEIHEAQLEHAKRIKRVHAMIKTIKD